MISIHAPARGATKAVEHGPACCGFQSTLPRGERRILLCALLVIIGISIHAPARGATKLQLMKDGDGLFQSTLPRGERLGQPICIIDSILISIHAPARGATYSLLLSMLQNIDFNPRSREGSDINNTNQELDPKGFQSTLPRGERLKQDILYEWHSRISIHAPARGATLTSVQKDNLVLISIHAPARGAT